ncbi:3-oxoacyl-[acyl-carrier-protein] synthase 2 [Nocardiopsis dassonvillei]|uniref:beta-ketoacyl-[acyl-carrier-protein] synthase family protein n=1 Tax=Nocardiopsis dassonvillei TaxID=2014 RepID=UPI003F544391
MSPRTPGVTITGIGIVTAMGNDPRAFHAALCESRSGLCGPDPDRPATRGLAAVGLVPPIRATDVLTPTEARLTDKFVLMGVIASDAALADAGVVVGRDCAPERTAVVVSNSSGGLETFEKEVLRLSERERRAASPYLLPGVLPNMATARVAIRHGIRGFSSTISTACSGGAQAVAEGVRVIREGRADIVVCGGSEVPFSSTMVSSFGSARALAAAGGDPAGASRPFDTRRTGFVLSEGAAVLVLERTEHARARGARGYADIRGWGMTTDAYHATGPRPDGSGAAAALLQSLADAGTPPEDVDYVNAHATGTKNGDLAEAAALRSAFGPHAPAVSSTKGATGHLLSAAGALEAAVCALSVDASLMPPTANLDEPGPGCELDHVMGAPRKRDGMVAVSTSFAFGGHNVSLVLGPSSAGGATGSRTGGDR